MASADETLERLIGAAFDRLPEPDGVRLSALERRLALSGRAVPARRRRVSWYWWVAAALVASGAAAWWGSERMRSIEPDTSRNTRAPAAPANTPEPSDVTKAKPTPRTPAAPAGTTEIYRRERY